MSINSKLSNNVFVIAAGVTAVAIAGCETNTETCGSTTCTAPQVCNKDKKTCEDKPTSKCHDKVGKAGCKHGQFCNTTSSNCEAFTCAFCTTDQVCNETNKSCESKDKKTCDPNSKHPKCNKDQVCNKAKKKCEDKVKCDAQKCEKYNADKNTCDSKCGAETPVCNEEGQCEAKKPDIKTGKCTSTWEAIKDFVAKGDYSVETEVSLGLTLGKDDYEKCEKCIEKKIHSTYQPYVKETVAWVKKHYLEAIDAEQQKKFGTDLTEFFNTLGEEAKTQNVSQEEVRAAVYAASQACGGPGQKQLEDLVKTKSAIDLLKSYGIKPSDIGL